MFVAPGPIKILPQHYYHCNIYNPSDQYLEISVSLIFSVVLITQQLNASQSHFLQKYLCSQMFIGPSIMIKLLWALYTELWIKYIIPALSGLGSMLCLSILHSQALWWTTEHLTENLIYMVKIFLSTLTVWAGDYRKLMRTRRIEGLNSIKGFYSLCWFSWITSSSDFYTTTGSEPSQAGRRWRKCHTNASPWLAPDHTGALNSSAAWNNWPSIPWNLLLLAALSHDHWRAQTRSCSPRLLPSSLIFHFLPLLLLTRSGDFPVSM